MSPALEQLVREAMEVTGSARPDLLEEDSPVLTETALDGGDSEMYFVGLIGGKDVGKSALINALVGKPITAVTSHGAGTEIVIAYAHSAQEQPLRTLLEREVPGQYRIVRHDLPHLTRQILLDLPDIDSRYASHLTVTRTMLRQMLYPIWVSSIEKYADQQPQEMLERVAEGNTPANFIFCMNKVDQLGSTTSAEPKGEFRGNGAVSKEDEDAAALDPQRKIAMPWGLDPEDDPAVREKAHALKAGLSSILEPKVDRYDGTPMEQLRADYAGRIAATLKLDAPPRVFLISAKTPTAFELPALRQIVLREKSAEAIREAKRLAAERQDNALRSWLDQQQLPLRAERLGRLQQNAQELIAERVAGPVLERIIPRLLDDPSTRSAMTDEILTDRVTRWPIVSLVHTLLQPLFILLRSAISRGAAPMQGPEAMVDAIIRESGESVAGRVQSAFASLRQAQPVVASLYEKNKLWEDMPADIAARSLRVALTETVRRQRTAAREYLTGPAATAGAPLRWLLTIGALIWFPFIQPVLALMLGSPGGSFWQIPWGQIFRMIVLVFGVDYLWKSAGFLIVYYAILWLALRWNTQRKVSRLISRWRAMDFPDPTLNLATQTVQWMDNLIAPISAAHDRMRVLADRAIAVRPPEAQATAS
ncbi:MAG TPA: GTPase domain-containing protein [Tepidisphaeraceae bacterium]|jgi:hypothetical protein|nr:GTPase domain-containing protein [Tepidisphaeraceae bacterium]